MAVTSIWPVKSTVSKVIDYVRKAEKTVEDRVVPAMALHQIEGVIEYTEDELKTERREYVTCLNCREEVAAEQFMETKLRWGKTDGRLCYHGYQSFRADEVDAETAHRIGVELARRLWGDWFEVVIATHCNTGHYHNHFVINSVSDVDGHKFYNSPADYKAMREMSDALCEEYGISVIRNPRGHGRNYAEYQAEQQGQPTVRGSIRQDIDLAIRASLSWRDFTRIMTKKGYTFKFLSENGTELKYPGIRPPGAKGYFRFHKLGEGYTPEEIKDRILRNRVREPPISEAEAEEVRQQRDEQEPEYDSVTAGLVQVYRRYSFELRMVAAHPASVTVVSLSLREEMAKLDRLDAQVRLLAENRIQTLEELDAYRSGLSDTAEELTRRRQSLRLKQRNAVRRGDTDAAESLRVQVSGLTTRLSGIRRELKDCGEIAARSEQRQQELDRLLDENITQRREKNNNELFGRRGRTGRADDAGRDTVRLENHR